MPLDVQTRLLRVLADGQFYRVGGYAPVKVDVRIIAATHQNLEQRVQEGKFREDLFHRLNVIRVHLPPLRERREDIPRLARHFLQVAAQELGVEAKQLHPETEAALTRLAWPGNVRQLENTCRWLTVMAAGQEVLIQDLPAELFETTAPESSPATVCRTAGQRCWRSGPTARCVPVIKTCCLKRSRRWSVRCSPPRCVIRRGTSRKPRACWAGGAIP